MRTIKQRIAGAIPAITSLVAVALQQTKDDSCLTLYMYQDKGEAMSLQHRDKNLVYWTMLVDGGYRGAPPQNYDMIVGTHAHADHISGILFLLERVRESQSVDQLLDPLHRISRIIINQPPSGEDPTEEVLGPEELRRLLREAEAGELSEDEQVQTARSLVREIVKVATEMGIPISAMEQGTSFPGRTPDYLHVLAIGPKENNLSWLNRNWSPSSRKSEVFNRASIMQAATYSQESGGPVTIVLTGDGWDVKVAEENPPDPQPAGKYKQDIQSLVPQSHLSLLKLPHHGSMHSEDQDFYNAVTADAYLCSSWAGGGTGLPSMETVRRIIKSQIRLGSTALYRLYFVLRENSAARLAQVRELRQIVNDPQVGVQPATPGRNYMIAYLHPAAGALRISWQYTGEILYPSPGEIVEILPG